MYMTNRTVLNADPHALAETLIKVLEGSLEETKVLLATQQLLLEGQPVAPAQIAARLRMSQDAVVALLRQIGVEWDAAGNVVGAGLSLTPTPHSYIVGGRQLYVWCAGDAITFPILHKTSAVIESPDPINGAKIHLIGTPEGTKEVEPSTAVVSWMPGTESFDNIRANFCNFTNFFTSVETASQYVAQHPGLIIVPIDTVFQIGKLLWEREPIKSLIADQEKHRG
jgi:alkylmercury lyase